MTCKETNSTLKYNPNFNHRLNFGSVSLSCNTNDIYMCRSCNFNKYKNCWIRVYNLLYFIMKNMKYMKKGDRFALTFMVEI